MNQIFILICYSTHPFGESTWKSLFSDHSMTAVSFSSNAAMATTKDIRSFVRFITYLNDHYKTKELQVVIINAADQELVEKDLHKIQIEMSLLLNKVGKLGLYCDESTFALMDLNTQKSIPLGRLSSEVLSPRNFFYASHVLSPQNTDEVRLSFFDLEHTEQEKLFDEQSLLSKTMKLKSPTHGHEKPIELASPLPAQDVKASSIFTETWAELPKFPIQKVMALSFLFFVFIPALAFSCFYLLHKDQQRDLELTNQEKSRIANEITESSAIQSMTADHKPSASIQSAGTEEGLGKAYMTILTSPSHAIVHIDDTKLVQKTPVRELLVSASVPMMLKIEKKGYKTYESMITLLQSENKILTIALKKN